jgi:hypothetical protein
MMTELRLLLRDEDVAAMTSRLRLKGDSSTTSENDDVFFVGRSRRPSSAVWTSRRSDAASEGWSTGTTPRGQQGENRTTIPSF